MLSCVSGFVLRSVSSKCVPWGCAGYSVAEPETLRWLDPESILSLGSRPSEAVLIMGRGLLVKRRN